MADYNRELIASMLDDAILGRSGYTHIAMAEQADLLRAADDEEHQARTMSRPDSAAPDGGCDSAADGKPAECANGCPPLQVCDYCQDVPVWRREWQGSGPQRGFHIRTGKRLCNAPILAYLGDQISGDAVDALIAAHNDAVQRDATPISDASKPGPVDVEARARQLLATEYERDGYAETAYAVKSGWKVPDAEPAIRAIIAALRQPAQVGAAVGDMVLVRREAIDWLNGESDFECPPDRYFRGEPPKYWWRSVFREKAGLTGHTAPQAAPVPVEGEELNPVSLRVIFPDGLVQFVPADTKPGYFESLGCVVLPIQSEKHLRAELSANERRYQPPEQPAVELEKFRPAVEALERAGRTSEVKDGVLHWKLNAKHYQAQELFALLDGAKAGRATTCEHAPTIAEYDHSRCTACGWILTDSGWGIARNTWFASLHHARFYKQNGRLPTPAAAPERDG